jgi:hypothetical protein
MKFDPSTNPPAYVSTDEEIYKGVKLRCKLIGTRVDATEIVRSSFLFPSPSVMLALLCLS